MVYQSEPRGKGVLFDLLFFLEAAAERAAIDWNYPLIVIGKKKKRARRRNFFPGRN